MRSRPLCVAENVQPPFDIVPALFPVIVYFQPGNDAPLTTFTVAVLRPATIS